MQIWVSHTVLAGRGDEAGLERWLKMKGLASEEGGLSYLTGVPASAAA